MSSSQFLDTVKKAIAEELDSHAAEISAVGAPTREIHITVKTNGRRVTKVIFSRMTEREIT